MEPYYYSKMTKTQQNVYHSMKTGLTRLEPSFLVSRLNGSALQDIFLKLRLDCPDIFYAAGFKYRFYKDAANVEIIPEYLFNKKKIIEQQKAMEARVNKLLSPARNMTDTEKELHIHNFICTNVRYDKLKKAYSHEIIGPLGQGVGVCEGIAKTIKILCDELGIWCIIAISDANADKNIKYRHAWNVIRIGGSYYHLDATFDNSLSNQEIIRYDYFNLDDKRFFRDHEPVIFEIPSCNDGDHFYYKVKKLSFTKMDDVARRVLQAIRKKCPLVFHWRGGYLTSEELSKLLGLLEQTAQQKGKRCKINLNLSQSVLFVIFVEGIPDQEIIVEEANEGEKG